jgi:hypothetical protein
MSWSHGSTVLLGAAAGVYELQRRALWAEARGCVYYVRRGYGSAGLGNAQLALQSLLEPTQRHVIEQRLRDDGKHRAADDPSVPGALAARARTRRAGARP